MIIPKPQYRFSIQRRCLNGKKIAVPVLLGDWVYRDDNGIYHYSQIEKAISIDLDSNCYKEKQELEKRLQENFEEWFKARQELISE